MKDSQLLETIFHRALELSPEARETFVSSACGDNRELAQEVNSLIRSFEASSGFMDESVRDLSLEILGDNCEDGLSGKVIGTYKLDRKLGEGGMGAVYLAEDTKLDRLVALKFLNTTSLGDNWAKRQLMREARAVAMLDHPNICSVHQMEEVDGHRFIVMQYIDGDTLSHYIREERIEAEQVLPLAKQIVDAIAAAHAHGIIHRDIKPGNIMLTRDGQVKVLDFGLAKIIPQPSRSDEQNLSQPSQQGLIQGTVAYMSPEQLKAEKLDYRSDIFSLGTVLYELATGRNPFEKSSDAETISAILTPDVALNGSSTGRMPVVLRRVIKKCLRKEKAQRYQSASEMLLDLQDPVRVQRRASLFSYLRILAVLLIVAILTTGIFLYLPGGRIYRTAVLPFSNETADTSLDYLTDGLAEDLITKLSGTGKLRVKAYTLVNGYRGSDVDNLAAGREVQADLVLSGKIFRQNDQMILRTNLLDTEHGITIRSWENRFELSNISAVENEIADGFLSTIASDQGEHGKTRAGSTTENGEAFREYLVGRYYWRRRDKQNLQAAIAAFERSIDLDPAFSRPYAGLADSYVLLTLVAYGTVPTKEAMSKAKAAARQALEIDPNNAEAHTSLGVVLTKYDWNWAESERELRKAVELDPDYAAAHYWLSGLLAMTGRGDESITEAEKAKELDPFSPLVDLNLARNYYYDRQYDRAIEILSSQNAPDQNADKKIKYMLGLAYLQKGMHAQAMTLFQDISADNKLFGAAALGVTYAKLGRPADARDLIRELERPSKDSDAMSQEIAIIYVSLNEKDKAFRYLNQAFEDRHGALIALKVEPLFDPIRSDPRFVQLLKKMALD